MPEVSAPIVEQPLLLVDDVTVRDGVAQEPEALEPPLRVVKGHLLFLAVLDPLARALPTLVSEQPRERAAMLARLRAATEQHIESCPERQHACVLRDDLGVAPSEHLPLDAPVEPPRRGVASRQGLVQRRCVVLIEPAAEE